MTDGPAQHVQSNAAGEPHVRLEPTSHTAERLKHASAEHLNLTTRRFFIGPIPEGWLNSHRKSWYKRRLELSNYSSRTATFSASESFVRQRQLTGLDGPSAPAMFRSSFPRPEDAIEESAVTGEPDNEEDEGVTQELEPVDTTQMDSIPKTLGIEDDADASLPKTIPVSSDRGIEAEADGRAPAGAKGEPAASPPQDTFVTAHESVGSPPSPKIVRMKSVQDQNDAPAGEVTQDQRTSASIATSMLPGATTSQTSLLPHGTQAAKTKLTSPSRRSLRQNDPAPMNDDDIDEERRLTHTSTGVRFAENVADRTDRVKGKISGVRDRASGIKLRRNTLKDGAAIKMEKMLVRIDSTIQEVPKDFDENISQQIETNLNEKWREYMVVVRQNNQDDADFRLQFYKSRVIPAVEDGKVKKKSTHEVYLNPRTARINMYSSLDKTIVLWHPHRKGSRFFLMRTRSTAHSVEWYTFLRDLLGWSRPAVLKVNVPDLSLTLQLDKPFQMLEATRDAAQEDDDETTAMMKTMAEEQAVAGRIIERCIGMLEGDPEWMDVLEAWSRTEKMGLAWKRYDRLEWVHGANEQKMYGSMAMARTHDLELRPKQHYPTSATGKKGKLHQEPPPLEGFLIRLTSQRGLHQRLGKMFFKRLYFTTQNQFLLFCRPAKTSPPHPPKFSAIRGSNVPSSSEIVAKTPLMYDVEPYPLENGEIRWLKSGNKEHVKTHDQLAFEESRRNVDNLMNCDGYINMSRIVKVRNIKWGATGVDDDLEEGSDVDFHQEVTDTQQDDGATSIIDDERTFELVLDNGLVVRLQAYNEETKKEWIKRLRALIKYWKIRTTGDMGLFKMIRQTNLDQLNIDEEMEAIIGQFARKWEVSRSEASPQLYNMCGIGFCRPISMSGLLYRKARRHATFLRCGVILANGKLLIFQGALRKRTGEEVPHIHQDHQQTLDLKDCYVYSGLVTEDDLLYQNQTFDSNHPGLHALPRIYLNDGWTSRDQDTMTCFVLWHGLKKSFFRANEEKEDGGTRSKIRQVSRLGVPGRSIVFKCRSRAERDHWVMSIGMEIDRLQQGEDVRLQSET